MTDFWERGKGETQSHRVGTNEKKGICKQQRQDDPNEPKRTVWVVYGLKPRPRRDSEKKSEIGGGRGKKNKNLGGPAESGPAEGGVGRLSGDTNEGEQEKT